MLGGLDGDREILFQLGLSGEIREAARTQPGFVLRFFGLEIAGNQSRSDMRYQLNVLSSHQL